MFYFYRNGDYLAEICISDEVDHEEHLAEKGITPLLALAPADYPTDPLSHKFREAWDVQNGELGIDHTKARLVKENELKANVDALLAAIDEKKIRSLSDAILTGDNTRLTALEAQAINLRGIRGGLAAALAALSELSDIDAFSIDQAE